jgi:hypothetical protein
MLAPTLRQDYFVLDNSAAKHYFTSALLLTGSSSEGSQPSPVAVLFGGGSCDLDASL